ncbi:MAG: endonuclease [Marinoscillum sp.]
MKKLIYSLGMLCCALITHAQAPAGYYSSASGLSGNALKTELNDIIDGHTEYSYGDLWDLLKVTDRDPNNSNNVIGIYSRFSMDAAAEYAGGAGWNREHVWAKSRGDFGTSNGPGTDLHHIRAEDVTTNSARSNKAFDNDGSSYVDSGGNYSGSTPAKTDSDSWFAGDDVKGDVARMIFYMAVRYEGENGEPDLELTELVLSNTDKQPIHGKLSILLDWHTQDPVSSIEMDRNDAIFEYQGNRNPFIDHPEYVASIWGSGGGGSSCNDTEVTFTLTTDQYPAETSWSLTKNGSTVASGSGYSNANSAYSEDLCLTNGTYEFTINDTYGDGICCAYGNGSYEFETSSGSLISGSQFTTSETKSFTIGSSGGGGASGDVIISEYVEGSSNNKAIEIANLSSSAVSLTNFSLKKQVNGAGNWSTPLVLSGTLSAQSVYVIVYSSAGSTLLAKADLTTSNSVMSFNGNDPIGLFENNTLIDVVGTFNGGSGNFAQNVTLQRKGSITSPSSSYSASEWNQLAQDNFDNVGFLAGSSSGGGGGGSTIPAGYCSSEGSNSSYEYISNFSLGSINNNSGNDGGYGDYSNLNTSINAGGNYSFSLTPAFPSSAYNEYLRIWVDLNRDGDFGDSGEQLYSSGAFQSTLNGSISIPSSAANGVTMMRVSMKYDSSPTSCETFSYGEVEDYAVTITGGSSRFGSGLTNVVQQLSMEIYPNPASEVLNINLSVKSNGEFQLRLNDLNGRVMYQTEIQAEQNLLNAQIELSNFDRGFYMMTIRNEDEQYQHKVMIE